MLLDHLQKQKLIHPPKFLISNCAYLTQMGSVVYGVSNDASDIDVYGFAVPPKDMIFPQLAGEIMGFGKQTQRFEQWQEHHVVDPSNQREYDFTVYSIVKYFALCMDNNPNMLDSLFTPRRCVLHSTKISEHMRENRKLFLHKGAFHKFKGYAYAQMAKIKNKTNSSNPKRSADVEKFGFDVKFAYHLVRLACECEQILVEHDLDLERNSEQLKSIRRGEWTLEQIEQWFADKEKALETLYGSSTLPHSPDEEAIKEVLLQCMEMHYGNLDTVVNKNPSFEKFIADLRAVIDRYS